MTKPTITSVLPFWDINNKKYLDLAVNSLLEQKEIDHEILIGDCTIEGLSGDYLSQYIFPTDQKITVRIIRQSHDISASKSVELLIGLAGESEYLFITNDDVIVGTNSLINLSRLINKQRIILNSLSNCDAGLFYFAELKVINHQGGELYLRPGMKYEDVIGWERAIKNFPVYQMPMIVPVPYNNFYGTMVRTDVFKESIGTFDDETLFVCGEDTCASIRAEDKGVECFWTMNSWVFHFGGRTISGRLDDHEKRQKGVDMFKAKYGADITKVKPHRMLSFREALAYVGKKQDAEKSDGA